MSTMDINSFASPCGIYCVACPRYAERRLCRGCRLDSRHDTCDIYECCVTQGGKSFCFECECFPCERLKAFARHGAGKNHAHFRHVAIENLESIRRDGVKRWTERMDGLILSGEYAIERKNGRGEPDTAPCPCVPYVGS